MISGIGINPFHAGTAVGAGHGVSGPDSKSEKPTEEKSARPVADPVQVKPGNIGGGSAIAAQAEASRPDADKAVEESNSDTDAAGFSEEERAEIRKLQARDREVKAHEAAHQAVGGQYAGAASFTFERGPNGRLYAVGGEVPIDVGAVQGDPDATIRKLRTVRRAALAPAQPSAQDRSIAVRAEAGVRQAQADKRAQAVAEAAEDRETAEAASAPRQSGAPSPLGEVAPGNPEDSAQPGLAAADKPDARRIRTDIQA